MAPGEAFNIRPISAIDRPPPLRGVIFTAFLKNKKEPSSFEIQRNARALSALLSQIEDYFLHLRDELEAEAGGKFRLGKNGCAVVLEARDNLRDPG